MCGVEAAVDEVVSDDGVGGAEVGVCCDGVDLAAHDLGHLVDGVAELREHARKLFGQAHERAAAVLGDVPLEALGETGMEVAVRVRSTREPVPGKLAVQDGEVSVVLDTPEEGVAPGQACVLYAPEQPDRVLGGGFIAGTVRALA